MATSIFSCQLIIEEVYSAMKIRIFVPILWFLACICSSAAYARPCENLSGELSERIKAGSNRLDINKLKPKKFMIARCGFEWFDIFRAEMEQLSPADYQATLPKYIDFERNLLAWLYQAWTPAEGDVALNFAQKHCEVSADMSKRWSDFKGPTPGFLTDANLVAPLFQKFGYACSRAGPKNAQMFAEAVLSHKNEVDKDKNVMELYYQAVASCPNWDFKGINSASEVLSDKLQSNECVSFVASLAGYSFGVGYDYHIKNLDKLVDRVHPIVLAVTATSPNLAASPKAAAAPAEAAAEAAVPRH